MKRRVIANLLLASVSVALITSMCEITFRILLFSDVVFMKPFRNAALYADSEAFVDNDYFRLYCRFEPDKCKHGAGKPHPVLGWKGDFGGDSYLHQDSEKVGHRRPVLLYGDSFAVCGRLDGENDPECFQSVLNNDVQFSDKHYLLNYGVSAYGLDQIYLLFKKSVSQYQNPFVIMSLMIWDLDRSIMTNRTGVKPFAELIEDRLVIHPPQPVDPSQAELSPEVPPEIFSYLYRLFLYQDWRPVRLRQYLRGVDERRRNTIRVSSRLLGEIISELNQRKIDYVFLIFYPLSSMETDQDWRERYLLEWMENNKVEYLSSKVIVRNDAKQRNKRFAEYYIPNDGHPSSYQYRIIFDEIKSVILSRDANKRVQH